MSTNPAIPSAFPVPSSKLATSVSPLPAPSSPPRPGRPRVLDRYKCHQILNLVFRGCTLEQAAYHVGCAASTIRREARRNPEFNEELSKMLLEAELFALNAVRGAANSHWRAGRWLIEHMAAQRTREQNRRPLNTTQLRRFTSAITAALESEIQDRDERHRISERIKEVLRETNRNLANVPSKKSRRQMRRGEHAIERSVNASPALEQEAQQNASRSDSPGPRTDMSSSAYGKITHYSSFADAARAASNIDQQPSDGAQQ